MARCCSSEKKFALTCHSAGSSEGSYANLFNSFFWLLLVLLLPVLGADPTSGDAPTTSGTAPRLNTGIGYELLIPLRRFCQGNGGRNQSYDAKQVQCCAYRRRFDVVRSVNVGIERSMNAVGIGAGCLKVESIGEESILGRAVRTGPACWGCPCCFSRREGRGVALFHLYADVLYNIIRVRAWQVC